jgi:hypothetical protein
LLTKQEEINLYPAHTINAAARLFYSWIREWAKEDFQKTGKVSSYPRGNFLLLIDQYCFYAYRLEPSGHAFGAQKFLNFQVGLSLVFPTEVHSLFFFFFVVLGLELKAYTLSHYQPFW